MRKRICFFLFFLMPSFGFLTHELGHFFSAKFYDYKEIRLHYNSTSYWRQSDNGNETKSYIKLKVEKLIVAGSGSVVTLLLGITGSFLFFKNYVRKPLLVANMIFLAVASLLLRFPFNLLKTFIDKTDKTLLNSDEYKMSIALSINRYFFHLTFFIVSISVLLICFFKLSKVDKVLFLKVGLPGGILGSLFWIFFLGPIVLP